MRALAGLKPKSPPFKPPKCVTTPGKVMIIVAETAHGVKRLEMGEVEGYL